MLTNEVQHRLLPVPLVVPDEDIEDDKKTLTKIRKFFTKNRSAHNDMNVYRRRSSIIVPSPSIPLIEKRTNTRIVRIRLVFIHIGDIDTLNEKYQADIYFEARWSEQRMNLNTLHLTPQQQTQLLYDNQSVRINELNSSTHWSPQLFIENAIGQIGEQDKWFTIKKNLTNSGQFLSPQFVHVDICEHRRIKGVFWEKLELNHFPVDVQDLTISISSHHHSDDCILVQDDQYRSIINREAFFDQQEWFLYEHVATEIRETKEDYSFEDENDDIEEKKYPVLGITCRAARQPGYYYWNGFCLIFLITICSFCIFSIPPDRPQSRLQITCLLLLTSITFRWIVNRSLPQISYLTILDIYAIVSIVILVILCIWHSIIGAIIFVNSIQKEAVTSTNPYVIIDRYVFIGLFIIYIFKQIALLIWLIFVPYKRRREMKYLDQEYAAKKYIQLVTNQAQYETKEDLGVRRPSLMRNILPTIKTDRSMRHSVAVVMMPHASSFVPLQQQTTVARKQAMSMVELREQDDEYYANINNGQKFTHLTHV